MARAPAFCSCSSAATVAVLAILSALLAPCSSAGVNATALARLNATAYDIVYDGVTEDGAYLVGVLQGSIPETGLLNMRLAGAYNDATKRFHIAGTSVWFMPYSILGNGNFHLENQSSGADAEFTFQSGFIDLLDFYKDGSTVVSTGAASGTVAYYIGGENNAIYLISDSGIAGTDLNMERVEPWPFKFPSGKQLPLHASSTVFYNNRIWVVPGIRTSTTGNSLSYFDVSSKSWSDKIADSLAGNPMSKLYSPYVALLQSRLFVFGGRDSNGNFLNGLFSYDLAGSDATWLQHLPPAGSSYSYPFIRSAAAFWACDGFVFAAGGLAATLASDTFTSSTYLYAIDTNDGTLWKAPQQLPARHSAVFSRGPSTECSAVLYGGRSASGVTKALSKISVAIAPPTPTPSMTPSPTPSPSATPSPSPSPSPTPLPTPTPSPLPPTPKGGYGGCKEGKGVYGCWHQADDCRPENAYTSNELNSIANSGSGYNDYLKIKDKNALIRQGVSGYCVCNLRRIWKPCLPLECPQMTCEEICTDSSSSGKPSTCSAIGDLAIKAFQRVGPSSVKVGQTVYFVADAGYSGRDQSAISKYEWSTAWVPDSSDSRYYGCNSGSDFKYNEKLSVFEWTIPSAYNSGTTCGKRTSVEIDVTIKVRDGSTDSGWSKGEDWFFRATIDRSPPHDLPTADGRAVNGVIMTIVLDTNFADWTSKESEVLRAGLDFAVNRPDIYDGSYSGKLSVAILKTASGSVKAQFSIRDPPGGSRTTSISAAQLLLDLYAKGLLERVAGLPWRVLSITQDELIYAGPAPTPLSAAGSSGPVTTYTSSSDSKPFPIAAAVGGAIGGVVLLALLGSAAYWYLRKRSPDQAAAAGAYPVAKGEFDTDGKATFTDLRSPWTAANSNASNLEPTYKPVNAQQVYIDMTGNPSTPAAAATSYSTPAHAHAQLRV